MHIPTWNTLRSIALKSKASKTTVRLFGIKAALQGEWLSALQMWQTTARFPMGPAAAPPTSQTGFLCLWEGQPDALWRVVRLWHWANHPTPPVSHADGQHLWPDYIFTNNVKIFRGLFNKTAGLFCWANNATFDNARRSAACSLRYI